jgi:pimeloyl-ACP methyl ester carboxylesterase
MKHVSLKSIMLKGGHFMLVLLSILLVSLFLLAGILLILSPGKTQPYLDEHGNLLTGSISEKIYLDINGAKQGMFIKSKDSTLPVLLILHGGIPVYYLNRKYPSGLEDYFTVVWWEQRGSGLSFSTDIPNKSITLEQILSDTEEVTNYLRHRFGKEKIYLMGHSGGTFIGMHMAARSPELYHAYIGVAQMTHQLTSEKLSHDYMLERYKMEGNTRMAQKLESAPVSLTDGISDKYLSMRDMCMHSMGIGTTHNMRSVPLDIFLPSLTCRDYTFNEKINIWRAKSRSGVHVLWETILETDLSKKLPEIKIPVYFFHGIYDYTVSYHLARDYYEKINAPLKGFYTFYHSAHSPMLEEPEKMRQIFQTDIFEGRNMLAD